MGKLHKACSELEKFRDDLFRNYKPLYYLLAAIAALASATIIEYMVENILKGGCLMIILVILACIFAGLAALEIRSAQKKSLQIAWTGWIFAICLLLMQGALHFYKTAGFFPRKTFHLKNEGESVQLSAGEVLNVDFAGQKIEVYFVASDQALAQLYMSVPNEGDKMVQTHPKAPFWTNSFDGNTFVYSCPAIDFLSNPRWVKIRVDRQK